MPDTFLITVIFIVLATFIGAFIRGRHRDKCLKDFSGSPVRIKTVGGKDIWGVLSVEATGLELLYPSPCRDQDGHIETSYILYKNEYPNIATIFRFFDELDNKSKRSREKELSKTYKPKGMKRLNRRIRNMFNTVKDSLMEILNLFIGQAKRTSIGGSVIGSQDKYLKQIGSEVKGTLLTSYEPLLEKYVGRKVVLHLKYGDTAHEHHGILKEYTANFIEIMDVQIKSDSKNETRTVDIVVPRKYATVRHLGE